MWLNVTRFGLDELLMRLWYKQIRPHNETILKSHNQQNESNLKLKTNMDHHRGWHYIAFFNSRHILVHFHVVIKGGYGIRGWWGWYLVWESGGPPGPVHTRFSLTINILKKKIETKCAFWATHFCKPWILTTILTTNWSCPDATYSLCIETTYWRIRRSYN